VSKNAELMLITVSNFFPISAKQDRDLQKGEKTTDSNGTSPDDPTMHHSIFSLIPLGDNEQEDKDTKSYKSADDSSTIPGFRDATPLHSKNVADHGTNNQRQADEIHLDQHGAPARTGLSRFIGEKEEDEQGRQASNGQVDIEAVASLATSLCLDETHHSPPSPRHMAGEGPSYERPNNARHPVRCSHQATIFRSLRRRHQDSNDGVGASEETCSTNTTYSATQDKG
jgi:hypothetical protein